MVVGNNRVEEYDVSDVENILKNFCDREKEAEIFERKDEEIDFMKRCLRYLDASEKDILEKIYFDKISVRKYSTLSGFSRNFIVKQKNKSIELLTKFFNVKFGTGS